jgi:ABC-type antimicrobial peptide transport system permease subunit
MRFPSVEGNAAIALQDAGSVVITERTAKKLFANENPLGKLITHNNLHALKVGAVIKDIPQNSTKKFDIVMSFKLFEQENKWLRKWDDNRIETWVQMSPSVNLDALNSKLSKHFISKTNDSSVSVFAYPLAQLRLHGSFKNGKPGGGRIYMVTMLSIIGLFVLLIACINFMNLATAKSEQRAREVGVRKVLGASRKLIIFQFFSEALLMTFVALMMAIVLVQLILPFFNSITERSIKVDIWDADVWILLASISLFTGLVAGSYPALFLSRFKPVKVLKGIVVDGKGGASLRRGLVTFQFMISIFFIIGTIVIYMQINHIRNRPLGYDQENLIDIPARGDMSGKFELFKNGLSKTPGIKNVSAGSDNILQFGGGINGMDWTGKKPGIDFSVTATWVQYNWTKTVGLKLADGRDFDPSFGTDTSACLINQKAVSMMELKEPVIGSIVNGHKVIGVLQDFVFNNPSGKIAPMVVFLNTGGMGHFFVRIENDSKWRQTLASIEKTMKEINPNYPVEFSFTKENYQKRFEEFSSFGLLSTLFGGMAIFISCLGLFGLSAFLAERRSKEMSIRKVLGASARTIWFSLSRDFLKPVFIAFLLALPLAVWSMQQLLSNMDYHINLSWWMFAFGGVLVLIIAIITISFQSVKAARVNPVKGLRSE